ncbi:non-ribosomal peptide synthetase [Saccharothrix obliqua]|uniref:non-ribosomal peptide synthetase n=1 Tax=Saccharothrix obliqua TaxID=2861747 RepID=UPI001C5E4A7B|nr:non-ribosomal peptide synthetase [Saccharothrix obliqua]MBW4718783.1 amino acid adenylation domain-containing protein [Saccharothrix obliqua]
MTAVFPCSPGQERLWFLDRLEPGSPAYNVPAALRLTGPVDVARLRSAFEVVVRRHAALRTVFRADDGVPVQVVRDEPVFAFAARPVVADVLAEVEAEIRAPFDLAEGPLLRVLLLREAAESHVLVVTVHHAVSDGWSMSVLLDELGLAYGGDDLPELPVQYADFVAWQREYLAGPEGGELLAEVVTALRGAPELITLPTDRPRPPVAAAAGGLHEFDLPAELTAAVRALGDEVGATVHMTVLAAYQALLSRYSGQDDVVVGTVVGQRSRVDTERLIGFFVNTVPVRVGLDDDPAFTGLLERVVDALVDALGAADVPFERVVAALRPERSLAHSPVYQVGFNGHGAGGEPPRLAGLRVAEFDGAHTGTTKLDLMLGVREERGVLRAYLEYRTDLFDAATVAGFAANLVAFLTAVAAEPGLRVGEVPLPAPEPVDPVAELPAVVTAAELVRDSDRLAVDGTTYRDLNARANRLAHALRVAGVGPDVPVGLCVRRSVETVVAVLAVWRAGGAYVPIDPEWPAERRAHVVADAGVRVAVVDREHPVPGVVAVDVDADHPGPGTPPEVDLAPDHLAYVIYTSGSTGEPKGVAVPHRGVVNVLCGFADRLGVTEDDVWAAITAVSFDMSVRELLIPLIRGARVAVVPTGDLAEPAALSARLAAVGATVAQATPTRWRMLLASGGVPATVRERLCGGEALDRELVRALSTDGARVWNVYGPTEGTMIVSAHAVPPGGGRPLLGPALPNTRLRVLDRALRPVPPGVVGQVHIGGPGVTRGYAGRPALTAAAFVPEEGGGRLYATGDLARWRSDGRLEFLGRVDHQVKVRGLRVEPDEVAAALRGAPGVADAAVVAWPVRADDVRLVAYVVGPPEREWPRLREHLATRLPSSMVPEVAVFLAALPLTRTGKVDRRALPEPAADAGRAAVRVAPRDEVERALAGLWADVLGVTDVGVHDDFFALGGHSLLAARLVARVRERFSVELPLRTLFDARTVARFAEALRARGFGGASAAVAVPRRDGDGAVPLLPAQRQLWFLDRLGARDGVYTISQSWRLTGVLDVDRFRAALGVVVDRHEALRAGFPDVDGEPVQVIAEPGVVPEVAVVDLRHLDRVRLRADAAVAAELRRPFDLTRPPLLRALVVRTADTESLLVLTLHHMVADAASVGVLLRELNQVYRGEDLPEPPVQYGDYAVWHAAQPLEAGERYWRDRLGDAPALLELPTDRPRPPAESFRGGGFSFHLPRERADEVAAFCRARGVTVNTVLLTAFTLLLARYSGQDDIVVGTPMRDESVPGVERCVGMYANTVAVRTRLDGDPTAAGVLDRVQDACVGALEHQRYPWELVARALRPARDLSHNPVFQVMFVLNHAGGGLDLPGVAARWLDAPVTTARFDLTLALATAPDGIEGRLDYATDLFDEATAARLAAHYDRLLGALLADADRPAAELSPLTAADLRWLHDGGHATPAAPLTDGTPVHRSIAAQAERTPDAPAIGDLSYRELVRAANGVARVLRERGVRRGDVVALGLPLGADAAVGLLGVLVAGAAYLPLDPGHPPARLAALLADARPVAVVTSRAHAAAFEPDALLVDDITPADTAPEVAVGPDDIAYVIYTSGSTGSAKAVAVRHGPVAELAESFRREHGFGPGERVLVIPPLTFDAAVGDIFPALVSGAALLPWADAAALTGPGLVELCGERGVTMVDAPSALWQKWTAELAAEGARVTGPLRLVMVGGEGVPVAAVRTWAELTDGRVPLHNHYGPTEATVCTTTYRTVDGAELGERTHLPIGRPLPHARAYVVDAALRPVPTGVPGELCLGGDAPARGYLGRPGTTAAHFVPDPFASTPGARMYRTGDLVRRRADGELEFLGRVDRQLKLHGHRIEPAEVEAACRRCAGVRDALVVARGGRLVGYLVGDAEPAAVRGALRSALPNYLVPDAFVVVDALPLTANGKVDHTALPEPAERAADAVHTPPEPGTEEDVAAIWSAVLDRERIGRDDDFFALGGHSLLAGTVTARVRAKFGVDLPVRVLFEATTLTSFAAAVELRFDPAHVEDGDAPDLGAEAALPADVRFSATPAEVAAAVDRAVRARTAFLVGATGFIGGHLLADLLTHSPDVVVRCLVRSGGLDRIAANLRSHGLWRDEFADRVVPVAGDLSTERFGLSEEGFAALADGLDVIFHCGGEANFVRPYAHLRPGNVLGTTDVLRLACLRGVVPTHIVSTLGAYPLDRPVVVTERDAPDDPTGLARGYERSKWVADRLARAARAAGLPVTVHRPARVTGDSRTGIGPVGDRFANMLRAVVVLGSAPLEDFADEEDMAPVDYVAAAIGTLSRTPAGYGADFHFYNPRTIRFGEVVDVLRDFGYPVRAVPFAEWHAELSEAVARAGDPALSAIAAVVTPDTTPRRTVFDCSHTEATVGRPCPPADAALLRKYLTHYVRTGHLPAPQPMEGR